MPKADRAKPRVNGNSYDKDTAMDIDEGISQPTDQFDFENEEEELDPAKPYWPIIQDLNMPMGTAVLNMSFPRLPQSFQQEVELTPRILQQNLVVALGCADSTVRILTLPLMPPSPQRKKRQELQNDISLGDAGHGSWEEQLVTIPSASGRRSLAKDISIALMPHSLLSNTEDAVGDDEENELPEDSTDDLWDLLIASCTSDQPTDFAIHRIPVSADGLSIEEDSTAEDTLWKTGHIANPVVAVDLYVPVNSDAEQAPCLLLAEASGAVRVFDCCASSDTSNCRLIRCFSPGFETIPDGSVRSRTVLDAKFVLGGQAVTILTADGEWGVWNISLQNLVRGDLAEKGLANAKGLSMNGGIPTKFAVNGWMGGVSSVASTVKSSSGKPDSRSKLAPMTPGTRKVRQEALFTGSGSGPSRSTSGGIFLQSSGKFASGKNADDMVGFWHGDKTLLIPSLSAHWQNKSKGSGSLFGDATGQVRELSSAVLGGEIRNAVSMFPPVHHNSGTSRLSRQPDILVSGERSVVVLSPPLSEEPKNPRQHGPPVLADQQLLMQGNLDVGGIDRILDNMSNGNHRNGNHIGGTAAKRRVGFTS